MFSPSPGAFHSPVGGWALTTPQPSCLSLCFSAREILRNLRFSLRRLRTPKEKLYQANSRKTKDSKRVKQLYGNGLAGRKPKL